MYIFCDSIGSRRSQSAETLEDRLILWTVAMSSLFDRTSMGGQRADFQTTRWSEIIGAQTTDDVRRKIVMDSLLGKYWKPVYCYIRHQGYDNEQAKDWTQSFFLEIVINSNLIAQADQTKGRFRSFLLTALNHYLVSMHRKETAKKRRPPSKIRALESDDLPDLPQARSSMSPDQIFNYVWATDIIDQVILQVEQECCHTGKEQHWQIFCAKILIPIMENKPSAPIRALCRQFGIESEAQASNMIVTVKRCFRRTLEDQLRHFVQTDGEIEDEMKELLGIISQDRAG